MSKEYKVQRKKASEEGLVPTLILMLTWFFSESKEKVCLVGKSLRSSIIGFQEKNSINFSRGDDPVTKIGVASGIFAFRSCVIVQSKSLWQRMMVWPQQKNNTNLSAGMTFVEMIVVLSIFAMMSIIIMNAIVSFYRYNAYTIAQSYQVNFARRGVETMVRDIREMTYADDGAFPLVSRSTSSIMFYSDIDRDDSVELVEFQVASTTLYKYVYDAVGSPPSYSTSTPDATFLISEYVNNISESYDTFTFYDTVGAVATSGVSVADIRYIDVGVIINIDPVRDPGEFLLRSSASLRNLKEYDN